MASVHPLPPWVLRCRQTRQATLAGWQSVDLRLEVFVLAVLSNHRLDQVSYRLYRLAFPDAYYRRVVGSGRVDGQGDALRQARL
jgi:hypothetical protein